MVQEYKKTRIDLISYVYTCKHALRGRRRILLGSIATTLAMIIILVIIVILLVAIWFALTLCKDPLFLGYNPPRVVRSFCLGVLLLILLGKES